MTRRIKYIFITGGVISSLGKGISAAAIGSLLELRGLKVSFVKMDPYINVDPGTMNPMQHGEVFVTGDGAETDMDLGHYERFTHTVTGQLNNFTSGRIYHNVIGKERRGEYLGATVQVIPHITDEIQRVFVEATRDCDIALIEVGGTVGDIESLPFLEAIRQFRSEHPKEDVLCIHVTLVPYIAVADEIKTKPTQHSVAALRQIGIQPDILVCRSERPIPEDIKKKLALFCNVGQNAIFGAEDLSSVYKLPVHFHAQGLDNRITDMLNIWSAEPNLHRWLKIGEILDRPGKEVTIALVGKYVSLKESYKSLNEALIHAGIANDARVKIRYIDSELLETDEDIASFFVGCQGMLIPGGFGVRGTEGKIRAIEYARIHKIPLLGICLGMQLGVVEYARNVCGWQDACSTEFLETGEETQHPVIDIMKEQIGINDLGGTMRLGNNDCVILPGTLAEKVYGGAVRIVERHRHRYEVNNRFREELQRAGLVFSATSPDGTLAEICEIPDHPWFLCCQFHPEYCSKPFEAHPIFANFIRTSTESERL